MRFIPHQRPPRRELIQPGPTASFVARRFRPTHFPFVWHYHPEIELTYIVSGTGLRFLGDSIEAFGPGDLVLIGANVPHTWQTALTDEASHVESIVFQFSASLFGDALERLPECRDVWGILTEAARGLSADDPACRDRVHAAMLEVLAADAGSMGQLIGLLRALQLVAEGRQMGDRIVRFISSKPRNDARTGDESTARLEQVLQLLNESLDAGERLTQAAAAKCVHMSPAAFSRFFRRKVGRTFARYANEWRVELACRQLVQSNRSITEIAFDSGFENLSNFNRRFHQVKGMTPRDIRKRHGKK